MSWWRYLLTQSFPPSATFTEESLQNQNGKVFIVTGGASGIGFELSKVLHRKNATIYIAGRSEKNAHDAINTIKRDAPQGCTGRLEFLYVDFNDLATVKPAVQEFTSRESKLDVLWNNAGVGRTEELQKSAQGVVVQYSTNVLGPYLFTELLQSTLEKTAAMTATPGNVRVVWTGSMVVDAMAPNGLFDIAELDHCVVNSDQFYVNSKIGNIFLGSEMAKREAVRCGTGSDTEKAVVHVSINPGNLKTPVWRACPWWMMTVLNRTMLHDAKLGVYTMIWAGLSDQVTLADNGRYIIPWGRWHPAPRQDLLSAMKSKEEGGNGLSLKFVDWCEKKCERFR